MSPAELQKLQSHNIESNEDVNSHGKVPRLNEMPKCYKANGTQPTFFPPLRNGLLEYFLKQKFPAGSPTDIPGRLPFLPGGPPGHPLGLTPGSSTFMPGQPGFIPGQAPGIPGCSHNISDCRNGLPALPFPMNEFPKIVKQILAARSVATAQCDSSTLQQNDSPPLSSSKEQLLQSADVASCSSTALNLGARATSPSKSLTSSHTSVQAQASFCSPPLFPFGTSDPFVNKAEANSLSFIDQLLQEQSLNPTGLTEQNYAQTTSDSVVGSGGNSSFSSSLMVTDEQNIDLEQFLNINVDSTSESGSLNGAIPTNSNCTFSKTRLPNDFTPEMEILLPDSVPLSSSTSLCNSTIPSNNLSTESIPGSSYNFASFPSSTILPLVNADSSTFVPTSGQLPCTLTKTDSISTSDCFLSSTNSQTQDTLSQAIQNDFSNPQIINSSANFSCNNLSPINQWHESDNLQSSDLLPNDGVSMPTSQSFECSNSDSTDPFMQELLYELSKDSATTLNSVPDVPAHYSETHSLPPMDLDIQGTQLPQLATGTPTHTVYPEQSDFVSHLLFNSHEHQ